jgi:hypothetical protein
MSRAPKIRAKASEPKGKKGLPPTGIEEIDRLADLAPCTIADYVRAASAYVQKQSSLTAGPKKASQIRLSTALARSLEGELVARIPELRGRLKTHEEKVAGGLRTANADVSESHRLDGLRLAVELKPINLAVGRAIWNRFGDIRTFAVNIHLKFPFAVVGGVLAIPTYEESGTKAAKDAETNEVAAEGVDSDEIALELRRERRAGEGEDDAEVAEIEAPKRKGTVHLIERAIERLIRAGGRKSEAEAAHLLEGIAVVVYDPDTSTLHPDIPRGGSGLRWEEFIEAIASSYRARFED